MLKTLMCLTLSKNSELWLNLNTSLLHPCVYLSIAGHADGQKSSSS